MCVFCIFYGDQEFLLAKNELPLSTHHYGISEKENGIRFSACNVFFFFWSVGYKFINFTLPSRICLLYSFNFLHPLQKIICWLWKSYYFEGQLCPWEPTVQVTCKWQPCILGILTKHPFSPQQVSFKNSLTMLLEKYQMTILQK